MKSTRPCVATADTHALGGSLTQTEETKVSGGIMPGPTNVPARSADIGVTETVMVTLAAMTPSAATNKVFCHADMFFEKLTNAGTATIRFKEGAVTLFSTTGGSVAVGAEGSLGTSGILTNVSAAAHTYSSTIEFSTTGGGWFSAWVVALPMLNTDTHALTGAAGTCT